MNGKMTNKQLMRELRQLIRDHRPQDSVRHALLNYIIDVIEQRLTRVR